MPTPPTRYPTIVHDVTEVSLVGRAEPELWADRLAQHGLALAAPDHAEIRVLACASRYLAVPFREVSISVALQQGGVFLHRAWNSVRFFAWVERTMFKTPYAHATVEVSPEGACVGDPRAPDLRMRIVEPRDGVPGDDGWEGPIHLGDGRFFFGRLTGPSRVVPFDPTDDVVVSDVLVRSGFAPERWQIRLGAEHARSKTARA